MGEVRGICYRCRDYCQVECVVPEAFHMARLMNTRRIVLTGKSGGGKPTFMYELRMGEPDVRSWLSVPEGASLLFQASFRGTSTRAA